MNFLGGSLVRSALIAVEEAQEAGRKPSAPARFVASLPQRLGLRVGTRWYASELAQIWRTSVLDT